MTEPLFSPRWYRVSTLRPQLRTQVELRRQDQRGVAWFLLVDTTSDDVRRLNRLGYEFVGRCDGSQTVQQVWDSLLAAHPEEAMTQDEVVRLLIALHERGLIEFDVAPDVESIFRNRAVQRRRQRVRGINPLGFRLPMTDPSALIERLAPLARVLFCGPALVLWAMAMLFTALAAALHWGELWAHGERLLASPRYLFLSWLLYPFIKLLHELAHALAVRRWGATVRQAGISLMVLTPVPFVNASAADAFRHRHQRAIVSAAGIMAELAVAACAMAVWGVVQPGLLRDLALLTMLIGAASTVLVNGNPLMRFDGYFFLCDVLDLRNLSVRSGRWWAEHLSRLLGSPVPAALEALPGERKWLIAYAPLATVYRLALALGIGLWVGSHSALAGAALGGFMLYDSVLRPMAGGLRSLALAGRSRVLWRGGALAACLLALVALVPAPFSTQAQGVVWPPEQAQLRIEVNGFIDSFAAADGQRVQAGDLIATLRDERLDVELASLAADAIDLEVAMFQAISADPEKVPALREKLAFSHAEAARNQDKRARLQVRAQADGVLVLPRQADHLGSYRKKGELLGYLLTDAPLTVRVALPQEQAELVRHHADIVAHAAVADAGAVAGLAAGTPATRELQGAMIGVRFAEEGWRPRHGRLRRDAGGAVTQLPSAALGQPGGGDIAVDPADKDGLTPQVPVVLLDVEVAQVRSARIGARAQVRFDHGSMSIARQTVRALQQLLLQHVNPVS